MSKKVKIPPEKPKCDCPDNQLKYLSHGSNGKAIVFCVKHQITKYSDKPITEFKRE